MPLPLAAINFQSGTPIVGSHTLRATATDTAFKLGGKAVNKLLPSLGKVNGIAEKFVPSLSTYDKVSAAGIDNFSLGLLLGKSDIVREMSQQVLRLAGGLNIPGINKALSAISMIEKASDTFSSSQSSIQLFASVKNIDLDSIAKAATHDGAADLLSPVLQAFKELLQGVSHFTGQVIDTTPGASSTRLANNDLENDPATRQYR